MENINKQEIEWDEDHEDLQTARPPDGDSVGNEDEICIATKTDGHPCLGLKYKDTDYCYSHLSKMKMLPKTTPIELPKRGRPKKIVSAVAKEVAPIQNDGRATLPSALAVAPSFVALPSALNDSLVLKLTDKLKMKIDLIDNETKLLLKLLL